MELLKTKIQPLIEEAVEGLGVDSSLVGRMLQPSTGHTWPPVCDLSLPCFQFAKKLGMAPPAIAELLCEKIGEHEAIQEVKALNGFLNITASPSWLAQQLLSGGVGQRSDDERREVLIEHTSANPNGPFHVGRARNAILGDTLVRLHRLWGDKVTAEYYVDDMGKQVAVLAWALENMTEREVETLLADREPINPQWAEKADHQRVRWYQAAQLRRKDSADSEAIESAIGTLVHASEHGDQGVLDSFEQAYQPVLDGMLETLGRLGIHYDRFTKESLFVTNGDVAALMKELGDLEINGVADNGAQFLDLGQRGLKGKTEFFYRRGDGSSLYATRDIAYHRWKWTQCNELINVLGEDHRLQAQQVGLTLEELGERRPEVMFYSFIKLPEGKMSTRRGNVVFMDDLLEEAQAHAAEVLKERRPDLDPATMATIAEAVGTSAVRFNIISVSPEKGFTFRWEDALSFEAGSAPFVMYSHTRACSIRRNVEAADPSFITQPPQIEPFEGEMPAGLVELLRTLAVHDDRLSKVVKEHRPNLFANYMLQLSMAYNMFYRDCYVIDQGKVNPFFFAVSEMARTTLKAGMEALGLVALETM
ncbi:MAG: arginine--tRNA ligase [Euryarchaeota archaeon]|mgnify:FL=1|nr:arginine--tRNA ligase [Euryarchaeota archaeon]|tara:strand:+ start:3713 stop:5485 length:1773 start_codon:yes stop_codon:yes gene_type:complete